MNYYKNALSMKNNTSVSFKSIKVTVIILFPISIQVLLISHILSARAFYIFSNVVLVSQKMYVAVHFK